MAEANVLEKQQKFSIVWHSSPLASAHNSLCHRHHILNHPASHNTTLQTLIDYLIMIYSCPHHTRLPVKVKELISLMTLLHNYLNVLLRTLLI